MKNKKDKTVSTSQAAALMGQKGGRAFIKKYGKERMKELSKKAHSKRWGKKSK